MGWICEATVSEGVGHEEVTKFVVDAWDRDVKERKRENTDGDHGEEYGDDGETFALREIGEGAFDAVEHVLAGSGEKQGK
jgi:hypothetical protein